MKVEKNNLLASICKDSFYDFVQEFWEVIIPEKPVWNWHVPYLCAEIQTIMERVFKGETKEYDLVCNVSPGTTKSTIFSVMLPAWAWTRMPSCRFICVSYAYSLAMDLSRKSRDVVKSDKYKMLFPKIYIREDQDSKGYFINNRGGDRLAVGVGGSVMGFHAHCIVIDDPINPKQALSDAMLKEANDFMTETIPSRKVDKRITLTMLVMQRLHEGDPSGERLARGKDSPVRKICLPAELSEDVYPPDLAEKYTDGLMDPVRLNRLVLAEALEDLKEAGYAGQYMQSPIPRGGGMFHTDCFKYDVPNYKNFKRIIRYWDKASCFPKGTLIHTNCGQVPIEKVKEGDFVLTREGYKEVEWSGVREYAEELVSVLFNNGVSLTGTPDHLVHTENRGWVKLAFLSSGDRIVSIVPTIRRLECRKNYRRRNQSLIKELFIGDNQGKDTSTLCAGTKSKRNTIPIHCTELFGEILTEVFPVAIIYITRTKTGTITQSKILNVLREVNICSNTGINSQLQNILQFFREFAGKDLKSGGKTGSRQSITVKNAKSLSCQYVPDNQNIVLANADKKSETGENQKEVGIPVYDLSVRDNPEFFANGILVHNSQGGGAYTVGVEMALDKDGHYWILDVIRGQWDSHRRDRKIRETAVQDTLKVEIGIEQEGGGGGKDSAEATVRILRGFRVRIHKVNKTDGDKIMRADPLSSQVNAGNVYLVRAPWNLAFLNEFRHFPRSKYKDQVDAASGAFHLLTNARVTVGGL